MKRSRAILAASLLLLSGAVLALLIEHMIERRQPPAAVVAEHAALHAQMESALRLTPAQRDSITAIFSRHQALVDSAWRSINQRMHGAMDSVHREIESVLQPDQVEKFHQWIRQQGGVHRSDTDRIH